MALDAWLTKSIAVNSATTFYPTGAITKGGSAVDEVYFLGPRFDEPLFLAIYVPAAPTGTTPTLTVSLETDDNAAFSSPRAVSQGAAAITAAGVFLVGGAISFVPDAYYRIKLVAGGTTPNFGTVTATLTPDPPRTYYVI